MKKSVIVLMLTAFAFSPVAFANEDSVRETCKQEVQGNGVAEGEEFEMYVNECVEDAMRTRASLPVSEEETEKPE